MKHHKKPENTTLKYLYLLISFMWLTPGMAQQKESFRFPHKSAISVELAGSSFNYSFKYERILFIKGRAHLYAKAGFGYFPWQIEAYNYPRTYNFNFETGSLIMLRKDGIELGFGYSYAYLYPYIHPWGFIFQESDLNVLFLNVGYRYHFKSKKGFLSAAFTPMYLMDWDEPGDEYPYNMAPFGGISAGIYLR